MWDELKGKVYEANLLLPKHHLVTFTWGNASERDPESGVIAIKPSGVEYEDLKPEHMVVLSPDGEVLEGNLRPSSDTKTHLEIYRAFPQIHGIVHTHSTFATAWAQSGLALPCYGTTHADYLYGTVANLRNLTREEIAEDYEKNTGTLIVDYFKEHDPIAMPAVLCRNHGPFTWGKNAAEAVYHAVVLEEVAKMALLTRLISPDAPEAPQNLQDKHYERKHGADAYYGQE